MTPYIIVFITVTILAFLAQSNISKIFKFFCYIGIVFALSFLNLIRAFTIGTDTLNYIDIFHDSIWSTNIINYSLRYNIEFGFVYISFILKYILKHDSFVFFAYALIQYSILTYVFVKSRLNLVMCFSLLLTISSFYINSFNILRQNLAISLVILSSYFLINGKNKKFLIFSLIASTIHYSSIIGLFFYFVYRFKDQMYRYWFLTIMAIIASSEIALYFIASSFEKYGAYLENDDVALQLTPTLFIMYTSIFLASTLSIRLIRSEHKDFFRFLASIYSVYIGLILFSMINNVVNQGFMRMTLYFSWPLIFLVPIIINGINLKNLRFVVNMLVFSFLLFYFYYFLSNLGPQVVPFKIHQMFDIF